MGVIIECDGVTSLLLLRITVLLPGHEQQTDTSETFLRHLFTALFNKGVIK